MIDFFAGLAATFVTIPLLGFILVYLICRLMIKNTRKSLFLTIDITTIFFLLAVHYLLLVIVGKSLLGLIILILILAALVIGFITWKNKHEIEIMRIIRKSWRFAFLASTTAYFLLLFIGIIQSIVRTTLN
ncbi:DUF3397 domain-containing protein [Bacillus nitroreducens]